MVNTESVNRCLRRAIKVVGLDLDCRRDAYEPVEPWREPLEPKMKSPEETHLMREVSSVGLRVSMEPSIHLLQLGRVQR